MTLKELRPRKSRFTSPFSFTSARQQKAINEAELQQTSSVDTVRLGGTNMEES
jgi:hypothetical protein